MADFLKSAEKDAVFGSVGAVLGLASIPYMPQVLGRFTNVLVGAGLFIAGMYVNHDGLAYLFIGAGVLYLIDGAVRTLIPSTRTYNSFAAQWVMPATVNNYAKL
jgi:hypothetical protein